MHPPQSTPDCKPLPPQRWGILPTDEFWTFASLTPISAIFWVGAAVFLTWLHSFGWAWWQNAFAFLAFWGVWGGLVERLGRQHLARRQKRLLASRLALPEGEPADAPRAAPSPLERAPLPSLKPQRELPVVATAEFWDHAFERLFGRAAGVAHVLFNLALFMAFCYPAWQTFLLTSLMLLVIALGLGWWQRRLILTQSSPGLAAPAESSGPALKLGDGRRGGGARERAR